MKHFELRAAATCILIAGASFASAASLPSHARVVEVVADKDNVFKVPGQKKPIIYARPGEPLHLKITSHRGGESAHDGAVHSFVIKKLRDQGWDFRLKEGTEEFDAVAPQAPGEYLIECTVKCGQGHDDMNMKLVVKN